MAERDAAAAAKGKSGKATIGGKADAAAAKVPTSGPGATKPPAGGKAAGGAAAAKAGDGKGTKKRTDPLVHP